MRASFDIRNSPLLALRSIKGDIRRTLIQADLVDCMVGLPDRASYDLN